jgi:biopolymer transport protein ExbD
MTVYRGLPVTLPQAATGQRVPDHVMVTVTRDGRLSPNREEVSLERLRALFEAGVRQNPGLTAVISADEAARHGLVSRSWTGRGVRG